MILFDAFLGSKSSHSYFSFELIFPFANYSEPLVKPSKSLTPSESTALVQLYFRYPYFIHTYIQILGDRMS